MLRFAHRPLNITKNIYRVRVCSDLETELHLFIDCNVHSTVCAALFDDVPNFSPNSDLLNALSICFTLIRCVCFYLVYQMRRSTFQLLFLVLLTTF